VTFYQSKNQ